MKTFQAKLIDHYPKDKLLKFFAMHGFAFPTNLPMQPIYNATAVSIHGLSNKKTAYVIVSHIYSSKFPPAAAHSIGLCAVATVFKC